MQWVTTNLICNLRATPDKSSLPGDRHQSSEFSVQGDRLVTVSVPEYYIWDPEQVNLQLQELLDDSNMHGRKTRVETNI